MVKGLDGTEMPNRGVYLEVVENERLVTTDADTEAWVPSEKPFMTLIVTSSPRTARPDTRPVCATGRWRTRKLHEGWGQCADQLAALAATL